jgi:isoquinoline 1-oxidoreductase
MEPGFTITVNGIAREVAAVPERTLFEQVDFADGVIRNASLSQYRVPRLPDVPPVEAILIDRPDQPSAGGGETPLIAVAPALANAIRAATGTRLRSLSLTPGGKVT